MQRTGTTLLQRLLASHPQIRGVTAVDAFDPVASSKSSVSGTSAAQRQASFYVKALSYLAPDFKMIHPVDQFEPEEDVMLLDLSFMSQAPEAMMRVRSYAAWLERQDHSAAYAHFRKTLQLFQTKEPHKHWVLKSPHHMEYLDVVRRALPEAIVVETHRDPQQTMPSFCSMVAHSHGIFSDNVDVEASCRHWTRKVKRMMQQSIDVREQNANGNFLDISYGDIVERPFDALSLIYESVGIEFDAEARIYAQQRLDNNPQNRYGRHKYHLSDFGLDDGEIEREFSFYRDKYNIPIEL